MARLTRKTMTYSSTLFLFLLLQPIGVVLSEVKGPDIRLGEITFGVREFQSTPSPLKMLEIHIEVLNRSRSSTAPAASIKAVVVPKEVKYPGGASVPGFNPTHEETTITVPLLPNTGRNAMV